MPLFRTIYFPIAPIDDKESDKIMEVRRFLYNKQNQKELV